MSDKPMRNRVNSAARQSGHGPRGGNVRILLLVTAFNGLSQRAWCALREAGHDVGVQLATGAQDMIDGVRAADPELIVCPFLKDRVPATVWQKLAHDHHPPGPGRRPRPVLAGLGDHRGRPALGRDRAAGGRGDGRRADLGLPHLSAAARRAAQVLALQRAGRRRRDGVHPRGGDQGGRTRIHARSRPTAPRMPGARRGRRCARRTGPSPGPTRPSTSCAGSGPPTAPRAYAPRSAACRSSPTTRTPACTGAAGRAS